MSAASGPHPDDVAGNVAEVRERIVAAAARAGRDPGRVTLVAATKTVDPDRIAAAVRAGVHDVGENRVQELVAKAPLVAGALDDGDPVPAWHFLGALQRNKVRAAAAWVSCWQSVDRPELAAAIARHAPGARTFVEVNLGDEPQKPGCRSEDAAALCREAADVGLVVEGLMTVPPRDDDPRRWFAALRALAEDLGLPGLSMGMTDDFEVAVEEGATVVRVGRAIFGERPA